MSELPPAIPARGKIFFTPLDLPGVRVQMTTDPDVVKESSVEGDTWGPRKYLTMGIEGAVTTEDQGMFAIDYIRTLKWLGGALAQWLDVDVVNQIEEWLAATGTRYLYEDGEGNVFVVEFIKPCSADREFGQPRNYRVTLTLHALSMTTRRGRPYTGN